MLTLRSEHKCFSGFLRFYTHESASCKGPMNFSIFLPTKAQKQACPALYFLAGLGSSDENFMMKAGAERIAEELGIILVAPDTSPRNRNIDREKEHWTFGEGASFYLNATQSPWSYFYNMYDYVAFELPALINKNFLVSKQSIMGHSMGGHGALVVGLKNPKIFSSLSAFAPICHPTRSPWGQHAFGLYLGDQSVLWAEYDTVEILKKIKKTPPILIDQGEADQFLAEQLRLDDLALVARENKHVIEIRKHAGYDHSYYFISTFIESHLRFHYQYIS